MKDNMKNKMLHMERERERERERIDSNYWLLNFDSKKENMWILWKNSIFSFSKFLWLSFLNLSTLKYLSFWFLSLLVWSSLLTTNLVSANSDSIFTIEWLNLNQEHISSNWWNNWKDWKDWEYKVLKEQNDKDVFDVKENKDLRRKNFEETYKNIYDYDLQLLDFNLDWRKDILARYDSDHQFRYFESKKSWKLETYFFQSEKPIIFILMKNWKPYLYNLDSNIDNINNFLTTNTIYSTKWLFNSWELSQLVKLRRVYDSWTKTKDKYSWNWRYFIYNKNTDSNKSLFELTTKYWSFKDCNIYAVKKYTHYWYYQTNYYWNTERQLQDWQYLVSHNDIYYKNYDLIKKVWIEPINIYYIPICNQTWEDTGKIFDEWDLSLLTQSWRQDMNWDWYNDLYFYNFQTWKIEWYIFKKNIKGKYIYFEYDNSYSTWWLSSNDSYSKKWWDVMKSSNPDWTMNIQIYWKDWEEVWNISNIHDFEFKDFDNDWNKELFTFENYVKNWIEYKKMKIYVLNSEWKYEKKMEEKIVDYKVLDINGVWNKELIYTWLDWKSKIAYYKNWQFEVDSNIFWEMELRDLNNDWVQEIISKKKINWTNYYQFDFFKTDTDWYHKLWWSWVIWLSLSDELWDVNNDWLTDFVINKWWLWKVIYTKTTWWIDLTSVNWLPFIKIWETSLFKTTWFFIWTDWSNNTYFVNFQKDKENPEVISDDIFLFEYKQAYLLNSSYSDRDEKWYSRLKKFNKNNWYINFQWSNTLTKTWVAYTEFENLNSFNLNGHFSTDYIKNNNDFFWFKLNNWTYWAYIDWKIIITKYKDGALVDSSYWPRSKEITFLEWENVNWNWRELNEWWSIWNYDSSSYFIFVKIKNDSYRSWLYLMMMKLSTTDNLNSSIPTYSELSIWWQKLFNLNHNNKYNTEEIIDKKDLYFTSNQKSVFRSTWTASYTWSQYLIVRKNNNKNLIPWLSHWSIFSYYSDDYNMFQYWFWWLWITYLTPHLRWILFEYLNWKLWE